MISHQYFAQVILTAYFNSSENIQKIDGRTLLVKQMCRLIHPGRCPFGQALALHLTAADKSVNFGVHSQRRRGRVNKMRPKQGQRACCLTPSHMDLKDTAGMSLILFCLI